ncbi:MAG TPA: exodeoxyribonuclease III [Bacteroidales bacterium]|nr:exodeoxyribonuclease III [Bacteroidales bacterium]
MKIISYNVNGVRSALSKGLIDWLKTEKPDIFSIQETKAQPDQIDQAAFEALGYKCYAFSAQKKGYSGVATFSKITPDKVVYGMNNPKYDAEGRVLRLDIGDISFLNIYFPSGSSGDDRQAFKMEFLTDVTNFILDLKKERPNLVISGDYNICRLWIDIHNPEKQQETSGFLPEERDWFQSFVDKGFTDSFRQVVPEKHQYSWWSYRANARNNNKGWRIDYHMVSNELAGRLTGAAILPNAKHSDHCPVVVEIN